MKSVFFVITAIIVVGCGGDVAGAEKPAAPIIELTVENTTARLTWNSIPEATSYTLHYARHPYKNGDTVGTINLGKNTEISANLKKGTEIYVAVTSETEEQSSNYSNIELIRITNTSEDVKEIINQPAFLSIGEPLEYTESLCTEDYIAKPQLSHLIPVTLNNDEYEDFFALYQCGLTSDNMHTERFDISPNVVVAFVSDGSGDWYVNNVGVFGETHPSIGAKSRKWSRGDFNGDGFDDFAFATNLEDGRNGDSLFQVKPAMIVSTGFGTYETVTVGTPAWHHAVGTLPNDKGYDDPVFAAYVSDTNRYNQSFTYYNGFEWTDTTDQFKQKNAGDWATSFYAINATTIVGTDKIAGVPTFGFSIWKKSNNTWARVDSNFAYEGFKLSYKNWMGEISQPYSFNINGEIFIGLGPSEMCVIENFNNTDEKLLVAMADGHKLKDEIEFDINKVYTQQDTMSYRKFLTYRIKDNRLIEDQTIIQQVEFLFQGNAMYCDDINADGLDDLVIEQFSRPSTGHLHRGGAPRVFINNGANQLIDWEHNTGATLPGHSILTNVDKAQGFLFDVNNDGFQDLVVAGETTETNGDIEIYFADKDFEIQ